MNRKKALEQYQKQLFLTAENEWRRTCDECAEPATVGLVLIVCTAFAWLIGEAIAWLSR